MKNKIELLSPAGSFDSLKAAVNYGADAIYLGGTSFSARAFANNFNHEELIEAVKYCHLRGVKVYVTLNTLLSENELENALKEARFYYENKVDALIIQDLGLFYRIKTEMPDFDLHASTQMHIHNLAGVKTAKDLGFKKVVLARESNLDLIKEACKQDIEIECFIHGAICVSYSGQCLMSSVTKNRSANKGMCAQCCRLKYDLHDLTEDKYVDTTTKYLLSPKDMYLLEDIPELIEAGVSSLKIEGRLKSPSYVGFVTSLYRKAIDDYYNGKKFKITKEEYDNLLSIFNRGFTNSYLKNNDADIFGNIRPNHIGREIGKVVSYDGHKCFIRLSRNIHQFDGIRILNKNSDSGKILNTITKDGKYVSSANKGDLISIDLEDEVLKGDTVLLTLDSELEKSILNYPEKKRPIDVKVCIKENEKIFINAKLDECIFSKTFDTLPEKALKAPLTKENVIKHFSKISEYPYNINNFDIEIGNVFLPVSKLNDIRRTFFDEFNIFILNSFKRNVSSFIKLDNTISNVDEESIWINNSDIDIDNSIRLNPVINTSSTYKYKNIATEFGNILSKDSDKFAYYTLNVCNSYAYEFLNRIGFSKICLSTEINDENIDLLVDAYEKRNKTLIKPYILAYGNRTLMYIKRNPFKKYINFEHSYELNDNNNKYLIKFNEGFVELLEKEPFLRIFNGKSRVLDLILINNSDDLKNVKNRLNINLK